MKALYLFCLARPTVVDPLSRGRGADDQPAVSTWTFRDVTAVICDVKTEDFCGPDAERNMQNLEWIGPRACRHDTVVGQAIQFSPVLPVRLGTLFSSPESLERFMHDHYPAISEFLDDVTGMVEWSLKGFLDRPNAARRIESAILTRREQALSESPGMRYFERHQIRAEAEKELKSWLGETTDRLARNLCVLAKSRRKRRLLRNNAQDGSGVMVFNWAFLLAKTAVPDFSLRIKQFGEECVREGLALESSGPWPPYSFSPSLVIGNELSTQP